jgi:hypothetical protein
VHSGALAGAQGRVQAVKRRAQGRLVS